MIKNIDSRLSCCRPDFRHCLRIAHEINENLTQFPWVIGIEPIESILYEFIDVVIVSAHRDTPHIIGSHLARGIGER